MTETNITILNFRSTKACRTIAAFLILTFVVQDISWAHPDRHLAPPDIVNTLTNDGGDKGKIEWLLLSVLRNGADISALKKGLKFNDVEIKPFVDDIGDTGKPYTLECRVSGREYIVELFNNGKLGEINKKEGYKTRAPVHSGKPVIVNGFVYNPANLETMALLPADSSALELSSIYELYSTLPVIRDDSAIIKAYLEQVGEAAIPAAIIAHSGIMPPELSASASNNPDAAYRIMPKYFFLEPEIMKSHMGRLAMAERAHGPDADNLKNETELLKELVSYANKKYTEEQLQNFLSAISKLKDRDFNYERFVYKILRLIKHTNILIKEWIFNAFIDMGEELTGAGHKKTDYVYGVLGEISGVYEAVFRGSTSLTGLRIREIARLNATDRIEGGGSKEFDATNENTIFEFKFRATLRGIYEQLIGLEPMRISHLKVLDSEKYSHVRNLVYFGDSDGDNVIKAALDFAEDNALADHITVSSDGGVAILFDLKEFKDFIFCAHTINLAVYNKRQIFPSNFEDTPGIVNARAVIDSKIGHVEESRGHFNVIISVANPKQEDLLRAQEIIKRRAVELDGISRRIRISDSPHGPHSLFYDEISDGAQSDISDQIKQDYADGSVAELSLDNEDRLRIITFLREKKDLFSSEIARRQSLPSSDPLFIRSDNPLINIAANSHIDKIVDLIERGETEIDGTYIKLNIQVHTNRRGIGFIPSNHSSLPVPAVSGIEPSDKGKTFTLHIDVPAGYSDYPLANPQGARDIFAVTIFEEIVSSLFTISADDLSTVEDLLNATPEVLDYFGFLAVAQNIGYSNANTLPAHKMAWVVNAISETNNDVLRARLLTYLTERFSIHNEHSQMDLLSASAYLVAVKNNIAQLASELLSHADLGFIRRLAKIKDSEIGKSGSLALLSVSKLLFADQRLNGGTTSDYFNGLDREVRDIHELKELINFTAREAFGLMEQKGSSQRCSFIDPESGREVLHFSRNAIRHNSDLTTRLSTAVIWYLRMKRFINSLCQLSVSDQALIAIILGNERLMMEIFAENDIAGIRDADGNSLSSSYADFIRYIGRFSLKDSGFAGVAEEAAKLLDRPIRPSVETSERDVAKRKLRRTPDEVVTAAPVDNPQVQSAVHTPQRKGPSLKIKELYESIISEKNATRNVKIGENIEPKKLNRYNGTFSFAINRIEKSLKLLQNEVECLSEESSIAEGNEIIADVRRILVEMYAFHAITKNMIEAGDAEIARRKTMDSWQGKVATLFNLSAKQAQAQITASENNRVSEYLAGFFKGKDAEEVKRLLAALGADSSYATKDAAKARLEHMLSLYPDTRFLFYKWLEIYINFCSFEDATRSTAYILATLLGDVTFEKYGAKNHRKHFTINHPKKWKENAISVEAIDYPHLAQILHSIMPDQVSIEDTEIFLNYLTQLIGTRKSPRTISNSDTFPVPLSFESSSWRTEDFKERMHKYYEKLLEKDDEPTAKELDLWESDTGILAALGLPLNPARASLRPEPTIPDEIHSNETKPTVSRLSGQFIHSRRHHKRKGSTLLYALITALSVVIMVVCISPYIMEILGDIAAWGDHIKSALIMSLTSAKSSHWLAGSGTTLLFGSLPVLLAQISNNDSPSGDTKKQDRNDQASDTLGDYVADLMKSIFYSFIMKAYTVAPDSPDIRYARGTSKIEQFWSLNIARARLLPEMLAEFEGLLERSNTRPLKLAEARLKGFEGLIDWFEQEFSKNEELSLGIYLESVEIPVMMTFLLCGQLKYLDRGYREGIKTTEGLQDFYDGLTGKSGIAHLRSYKANIDTQYCPFSINEGLGEYIALIEKEFIAYCERIGIPGAKINPNLGLTGIGTQILPFFGTQLTGNEFLRLITSLPIFRTLEKTLFSMKSILQIFDANDVTQGPPFYVMLNGKFRKPPETIGRAAIACSDETSTETIYPFRPADTFLLGSSAIIFRDIVTENVRLDSRTILQCLLSKPIRAEVLPRHGLDSNSWHPFYRQIYRQIARLIIDPQRDGSAHDDVMVWNWSESKIQDKLPDVYIRGMTEIAASAINSYQESLRPKDKPEVEFFLNCSSLEHFAVSIRGLFGDQEYSLWNRIQALRLTGNNGDAKRLYAESILALFSQIFRPLNSATEGDIAEDLIALWSYPCKFTEDGFDIDWAKWDELPDLVWKSYGVERKKSLKWCRDLLYLNENSRDATLRELQKQTENFLRDHYAGSQTPWDAIVSNFAIPIKIVTWQMLNLTHPYLDSNTSYDEITKHFKFADFGKYVSGIQDKEFTRMIDEYRRAGYTRQRENNEVLINPIFEKDILSYYAPKLSKEGTGILLNDNSVGSITFLGEGEDITAKDLLRKNLIKPAIINANTGGYASMPKAIFLTKIDEHGYLKLDPAAPTRIDLSYLNATPHDTIVLYITNHNVYVYKESSLLPDRYKYIGGFETACFYEMTYATFFPSGAPAATPNFRETPVFTHPNFAYFGVNQLDPDKQQAIGRKNTGEPSSLTFESIDIDKLVASGEKVTGFARLRVNEHGELLIGEKPRFAYNLSSVKLAETGEIKNLSGEIVTIYREDNSIHVFYADRDIFQLNITDGSLESADDVEGVQSLRLTYFNDKLRLDVPDPILRERLVSFLDSIKADDLFEHLPNNTILKIGDTAHHAAGDKTLVFQRSWLDARDSERDDIAYSARNLIRQSWDPVTKAEYVCKQYLTALQNTGKNPISLESEDIFLESVSDADFTSEAQKADYNKKILRKETLATQYKAVYRIMAELRSTGIVEGSMAIDAGKAVAASFASEKTNLLFIPSGKRSLNISGVTGCGEKSLMAGVISEDYIKTSGASISIDVAAKGSGKPVILVYLPKLSKDNKTVESVAYEIFSLDGEAITAYYNTLPEMDALSSCLGFGGRNDPGYNTLCGIFKGCEDLGDKIKKVEKTYLYIEKNFLNDPNAREYGYDFGPDFKLALVNFILNFIVSDPESDAIFSNVSSGGYAVKDEEARPLIGMLETALLFLAIRDEEANCYSMENFTRLVADVLPVVISSLQDSLFNPNAIPYIENWLHNCSAMIQELNINPAVREIAVMAQSAYFYSALEENDVKALVRFFNTTLDPAIKKSLSDYSIKIQQKSETEAVAPAKSADKGHGAVTLDSCWFMPLGGAQEIGASSILIKMGGKNILVDAGLRPKGFTAEERLPAYEELKNNRPDAIIITHAHIDHCGSLPVIHKQYPDVPIFATKATLDFMKIMLKDSVTIMQRGGSEILFTGSDAEAALNHVHVIEESGLYKLGDNLKIYMNHAGHMPGAISPLLVSPEASLLVTGDVSIEDTILVKGMGKLPVKRVDSIISEGTYGARAKHGNREDQIQRLSNSLRNVFVKKSGNGAVLIPAFASGRAQEIILLLQKLKKEGALPKDVQVYVDGLVRNVNEIISPYLPEDSRPLFDDPNAFISIENEKMRSELVEQLRTGPRENFIVVASSGMLSGGPAVAYKDAIMHDWKNRSKILLVGYQEDGSTGDMIRTSDKVTQFQLSGHADRSQLISMINSTEASSVFLVHGDDFALSNMANAVGLKHGSNRYVVASPMRRIRRALVADNARTSEFDILNVPDSNDLSASVALEKSTHPKFREKGATLAKLLITTLAIAIAVIFIAPYLPYLIEKFGSSNNFYWLIGIASIFGSFGITGAAAPNIVEWRKTVEAAERAYALGNTEEAERLFNNMKEIIEKNIKQIDGEEKIKVVRKLLARVERGMLLVGNRYKRNTTINEQNDESVALNALIELKRRSIPPLMRAGLPDLMATKTVKNTTKNEEQILEGLKILAGKGSIEIRAIGAVNKYGLKSIVPDDMTTEEIVIMLQDKALRHDEEENFLNILLKRYEPFVIYLAKKYGAEDWGRIEDLENAGKMAVLEWLGYWILTDGNTFSTFINTRIKGNILRLMRDENEVNMPQWLKTGIRLYKQFSDEYMKKNGDMPTREDVMREFIKKEIEKKVLTGRDVDEIIRASNRSVISLDELNDSISGEDGTHAANLKGQAAASDEISRGELMATFAKRIEILPQRERAIASLYYVDGLSQKEIAAKIGISQMHVSRLLTTINRVLRTGELPRKLLKYNKPAHSPNLNNYPSDFCGLFRSDTGEMFYVLWDDENERFALKGYTSDWNEFVKAHDWGVIKDVNLPKMGRNKRVKGQICFVRFVNSFERKKPIVKTDTTISEIEFMTPHSISVLNKVAKIAAAKASERVEPIAHRIIAIDVDAIPLTPDGPDDPIITNLLEIIAKKQSRLDAKFAAGSPIEFKFVSVSGERKDFAEQLDISFGRFHRTKKQEESAKSQPGFIVTGTQPMGEFNDYRILMLDNANQSPDKQAFYLWSSVMDLAIVMTLLLDSKDIAPGCYEGIIDLYKKLIHGQEDSVSIILDDIRRILFSDDLSASRTVSMRLKIPPAAYYNFSELKNAFERMKIALQAA